MLHSSCINPSPGPPGNQGVTSATPTTPKSINTTLPKKGSRN
ncbi:hypothetical protein Hanom_Chr11g00975731 [Helianthus anomalus]